MKRRDIVIGILILAIVGGVIYWRQRSLPSEEMKVPETLSLEDTLEEKFKIEIPEDVDKAELKDVSGGSASAIATRKFENNKFTHSILADLPDPESGSFYEGWLVRGEEGSDNFSSFSTGRMRLAKGGFMLEFESSTDYSDHNKVVITSEKVADKLPEKHILEGSF
ncbi:hypothetical protein A2865_02115 [Candidatus Woesebacteria bacterium RIFCSPHIGHO2_01_FULL_39_17]|uniref:Anti-sigma factor n=3 Tax=Candidatus Woeseibacteriota TaxID=1752722 RepID=A0A0G0N7C1_9BACT|nr:MAG: hypothetical protein US72_C0004G0043 [Microgenomates group bacterium GW2011_GWC1_38_12]KKQ93597.1 MAG: hypothetical protein UT19_C0009G0006 [Candidatus Woesebacteria bacterium GW2011_GWB1_39_10b]KKR12069.1 MAG: hypothetical protein UT40_C0029G0021 [Candidatus Woesebacteria bacterium GW2011_GWA1_39_21b]OGM23104.1 MAG: hypothetical protein A2865_02115 [Candidatus Woesebacteria bacterium RIFCSPHIGHO2_01_FULL_39_17]OGM61564.1 MAG: hypothetical protein A3A52_02865 [Candidatus Woesebacteria b